MQKPAIQVKSLFASIFVLMALMATSAVTAQTVASTDEDRAVPGISCGCHDSMPAKVDKVPVVRKPRTQKAATAQVSSKPKKVVTARTSDKTKKSAKATREHVEILGAY